jgi:hypothetical protein
MIKKETDNMCICCASMGMQCQGNNVCPYGDKTEYIRVCDKCEDADETIYKVNGKELCEKCAFEELKNFNNMIKYVDSTKELQVQFYLNYVCGSDIDADKEKVSDKVIEIVRKECLEFPNMLYDDLSEFVADDVWDFVSFFAEPCGSIDEEDLW